VQLERQNANIEDEIRARVNDIRSLQDLLNSSRHENGKLENQLKAAQQDLTWQQVGHTSFVVTDNMVMARCILTSV